MFENYCTYFVNGCKDLIAWNMKPCFEYLLYHQLADIYSFSVCSALTNQERTEASSACTRRKHWVIWPNQTITANYRLINSTLANKESYYPPQISKANLKITHCNLDLVYFQHRPVNCALNEEVLGPRSPRLLFPWWECPLLFLFVAPCSSPSCGSTQPGPNYRETSCEALQQAVGYFLFAKQP